MRTLLNLVAKEIRPCRACGQQVAFVVHNNGRTAPYTFEGVNHFIDCPGAGEFRRRKAGKNA